MRNFSHFVTIHLLQTIQTFEGKYFCFYGIHIVHILTDYIALKYYVYDKFGKNRIEITTYQVFKTLEESISASMGST